MRVTLTDRNKEIRWFSGSESMISGAFAGLVSSIITCPLDVIKTKLQAGGGHSAQMGMRCEFFFTIRFFSPPLPSTTTFVIFGLLMTSASYIREHCRSGWL